VKCLNEILSFLEDCDPAETSLESVQNELFPERSVILDRYSPFSIVISLIEWVLTTPFTSLLFFHHDILNIGHILFF